MEPESDAPKRGGLLALIVIAIIGISIGLGISILTQKQDGSPVITPISTPKPEDDCGDGICETKEDLESCPADCPIVIACANGECEEPKDPILKPEEPIVVTSDSPEAMVGLADTTHSVSPNPKGGSQRYSATVRAPRREGNYEVHYSSPEGEDSETVYVVDTTPASNVSSHPSVSNDTVNVDANDSEIINLNVSTNTNEVIAQTCPSPCQGIEDLRLCVAIDESEAIRCASEVYPAVADCRGDLNGDRKIDWSDIELIHDIVEGAAMPASFECADYNRDDDITDIDEWCMRVLLENDMETYEELGCPSIEPETGCNNNELCEENIGEDSSNCDDCIEISPCQTDSDGDSYFAECGDCDDSDSRMHPGAMDICNGVDDDCDGQKDEDYVPTPTTCGLGICTSTGQLVCRDGSEVDTCTPREPSAEICDGKDNNCDRRIDEGFDVGGTCTVGVGDCLASGVYACSANGVLECKTTGGKPLVGESTKDSRKIIKLGNAVVELEFDRDRKGSLSQIKDLVTGQEFIPQGADSLLYKIEYKDAVIGTSSRTVTNLDANSFQYSLKEVGGEAMAEITTRHDSLGLVVSLNIKADCSSDLTRWRMNVDNRGGKVLRSVVFPDIKAKVKMGTDANDDELTLPYFGGTLFRNLEKEKTNGYPYSSGTQWTQQVHNYPGKQSMQFMSYYDPNGGVFLSTFDSEGNKKYFGFERNMDWGINGLDLVYKHVFPQSIGNDFSMDYDFVLTTFQGDWQDAADIYKGWARQQWWAEKTMSERDDIPEGFINAQAVIEGFTFPPEYWRDVMEFFREEYKKEPYSFEANNLGLVSGGGWSRYIDWMAIDYFEPDKEGTKDPLPGDSLAKAISELDSIGVTAYLWFTTIKWDISEKYGVYFVDTSKEGEAKIRMGDRKTLKVGDKSTVFGNLITINAGETMSVDLYGNEDDIEVKLVSNTGGLAKVEFYKDGRLFDTKSGRTGQHFAINLYYFDDSSDFDIYGREWALKDENGGTRISKNLATQSWGGSEDNRRDRAYMCIGDDDVMDMIIVDNIERAIRRGARYISLDQLIGGHVEPCWDESHGHPLGYGKWMHEKLVNLLERINQRIKDLGKWGEVVITMEEPCEMYNQLLQAQLICQTTLTGSFYTAGDKRIPMFDYVYKGTVLPYSSQGIHFGVNTEAGRWSLGTKYVLGNIPGVTLTWLNLEQVNEDIMGFHKKLVKNMRIAHRYSEHLNPPEYEWRYDSSGWIKGLPEERLEKSDPRNRGYDQGVWKDIFIDPIVSNVLKTPNDEISYLFVDTREPEPLKLLKPYKSLYTTDEEYQLALELYENEPVPKDVEIRFEISDYNLGHSGYKLIKIVDGQWGEPKSLRKSELPYTVEFTITPEEIVEYLLQPA
jgi:hypothetical protein